MKTELEELKRFQFSCSARSLLIEMLHRFHRLQPVFLLCALASPLIGGEGRELSVEDRKFFEDEIRPLLSENCYECHSEKEGKSKGGLLLDRRAGWQTGGDSGRPVIDVDQPEQSMLIRMVHHDPDFEAMPPKSKLSDEEIAKLEEWVKRGAPDPREEEIGEAVVANDFDLKARSYWWSLQPLVKASVPEVRNKSWPINDYDRFILSRLEQEGWEPADAADKATLLRRAADVIAVAAVSLGRVGLRHCTSARTASQQAP